MIINCFLFNSNYVINMYEVHTRLTPNPVNLNMLFETFCLKLAEPNLTQSICTTPPTPFFIRKSQKLTFATKTKATQYPSQCGMFCANFLIRKIVETLIIIIHILKVFTVRTGIFDTMINYAMIWTNTCDSSKQKLYFVLNGFFFFISFIGRLSNVIDQHTRLCCSSARRHLVSGKFPSPSHHTWGVMRLIYYEVSVNGLYLLRF